MLDEVNSKYRVAFPENVFVLLITGCILLRFYQPDLRGDAILPDKTVDSAIAAKNIGFHFIFLANLTIVITY